MKLFRFAMFAVFAAAILTGCETIPPSKPYRVSAHQPKNPNAVRVKVSLKHQAIYVLEGSRPLMVAATCVGTVEKPTPRGNFTVYKKIAKKRSGSYGFSVSGGNIRACTAGNATGRYVGYPMAYWVEFAPAYGFHEGYVWPTPRTHGCLRLHKEAAAKFFALTKIGTAVNIAYTQPEDETLGRNIPRPTDYRDPDPPAALMVSDAVFTGPKGPLFVD